ncbi:MAG: hypothetical protein M3Y40_00885 [Chloroflexota bacterium]|nr:hypothetical protein [Chloroflexota bacterium]
MSCRRIRRELLWLSRFGELGPSSQPHLDHLVGCRGCRDEVGFDREMVRQLRVALAERVEGIESTSSFEAILRRAQAPEPTRFAAWWQRSIGLVGRLRTATAMAGTGLALVLALQMEVVPIAQPTPDMSVESPDLSMLEEPHPYAAAVATRTSRSTPVNVGRPHPEATITLPPPRGATEAEPEAADAVTPPGELVVLDIRFERTTASVTEPATEEAVSEPVEEPVHPVPSQPGQPS